MSDEMVDYTYLVTRISVVALMVIAVLLLVLLIVMLRYHRMNSVRRKAGYYESNVSSMDMSISATEPLESGGTYNGFQIEYDITYIHTDEVIS